MAEISNQDLLAELGVEAKPKQRAPHSAREERIIAGFEAVQRFVDQHNRLPEHGEDNDIFERLYATRLEQIQKLSEHHPLLINSDIQGLLSGRSDLAETSGDYKNDDELLAELGITTTDEQDIAVLRHVKTRVEVRAAEEVAQRLPCTNFTLFKPLFDTVQHELTTGLREAKLLLRHAKIAQGDLFILNGQKAYVAEVGDEFVNKNDRKSRRLRVIYDNGTESALLFASLQRALDKDDMARRIIEHHPGPIFSGSQDIDDSASGTIYVLRSKSEHLLIKENRNIVHKIGVTGGRIEKRIANAALDPTFLMAEVETVASYELFNINRAKLERLIHRFFESAQLDIEINDRFGNPVAPQEWFLVPLNAIDEAVERIKDGSISRYAYDTNRASVEPMGDKHGGLN
jgi:hypothetical protein